MTGFPILIAEWERNAREVVRAAIDSYRRHSTIDVGVWWRAGNVLKPGKTSITLGVRNVENLAGVF